LIEIGDALLHKSLYNKEIPMPRSRLLLLILAQVFLFLLAGCGSQKTPAGLIFTDIPISLSSKPKPISTSTTAPADEPAPTVEPASSGSIFHLIYDDDGSRDGTVALLYLLNESAVNMMAINISYGEAHPDTYIQHIGRMVDEVGHTGIPLGAGKDGPVGNGTPFPEWLPSSS
jgi:hypothetical protein